MSLRSGAVAGLLALAVAGCAAPGPRLGTQWSDPQAARQSLQGARVLVFCDAPDTALRLHCESSASTQLLALGAQPLTDASLASPTPGREPPAGAFLGAARAAGARAVFSTTLAPDFSQASAAPTFSIGIGGFGGSGGYRGGSGIGGGIGVTLPAGGTAPAPAGVAAIASLIDADSGRVIWTARATAPPAADLAVPVGDALRLLAGSLAQAGVF